MTVLALNASHSVSSSTHHVAALAVDLAGEGRVVDLATLDPGGLLGVREDPGVRSLLDEIPTVDTLVLVTPIYRATYSGILKVLFDQLAPGGLRGVACVLAATAGSSAHYLSLDTGMRSLVASVGGWSVPNVVYVTPDELDDAKRPLDPVRERMASALRDASQILR